MKQETCLKKCGTSVIAAAIILVILFSGLPAFDAFVGEVSAGGGDFAGGNGTAENPYQIEDILDLQNMSADLNAYYVLVKDIDASATGDWNDGKGFEPVGDYPNEFTGSLGGQDHKITGLFINRASEGYVGLFGCVGTGGSVSNISLVNVNISGYNYVGGLVGYNYDGTVQNCSATGNVSGNGGVGGLVGYSRGGTVENSSATGNVSGDNYYVGGLVGYNYYGTVNNCHATGNVSGNNDVGGLVGYNSGTVQNCYATGSVNGTRNRVGGLVGGNYYGGTVKNSYATGNVSAVNSVGGLVGWNDGTVENCSATGNVSGNGGVGGLVGSNSRTVENSFYCINHTTLNGNNIVTPYGIYKSQFEDWLDDRTLDINDYLHIVSGTDYYRIGSISDLKNLLPFALEGYKFRQTADIDLSTEPGFYIPVFDAVEYDGDGHSISGLNLTYLNNSAEGFFGKLGSDSRVSNISLIDCNVSGNNYVGGLVGVNNGGTVENCYATGNVSGNDRVGGLVGDNGGLVGSNSGTVTNCSATANVSGDDYVGGLVGFNRGTVENSSATGNVSGNNYVGGLVGVNNGGTVENCSATGKVSSNNNVGGLVGRNWGTVKNCYATGNVSGDNYYVGGLVGRNHGTMSNCSAIGNVSGNNFVGGLVGYNSGGWVKNCFWDIETSGTSTSDGGTGKNTTDMMKKSTFTDAGWDFEDIWNIIEGKTYPYLRAFTYSPIITTEDVTEALEDHGYTVQYHAVVFPLPGCGHPQLLWHLETNAGWLSMSTDGVLTGTPTNDDVGSYWVNVSVSDGKGGFDYRNFTLTVVNTNDPPEIQTTALPNGTAGQAYGYNLTAIDVDDDTLVWSMETNASWLTLNPSTGTLQGTPSGAGTFWVNISVSDGKGGTDSVNLTITILPDLDGDGIPDPEDTDMDGDGVPNTSDAFPNDPAASVDTDNDGYPDEWNTGKSEADSTTGLRLDTFPNDPAASKDTDGDGYPDEWNTGKSEADSTIGLKLDAFPKDPTKWEEESNGNESFLSQKIGPLPLYALIVFVIIGLAAGAGALKMKGGKSGGKAQKTEQSQQFPQQPPQPPWQQFPQQQPTQPVVPSPGAPGQATWLCPQCGNRVEQRFIFCTECGFKRTG